MACCSEGATVIHASVIAAREDIPPAYLTPIFLRLKRANAINSTRGQRAAIVRPGSPGEITVGDAIRAAEGAVNLVFCVDPAGSKRSDRAEGCVARDVWAEASRRVICFFDSVTPADLCDRATNAGIPIQEEG
jgi:Rrf2 family transcriptional regulator, cysteine metabolism repressor